MSNPKNAIQQIKNLMKQYGFLNEGLEKESFLDAKLVDGTQIKVEGESLVEGAAVIVVTEEAELPAPDGVHELEDGTKVETKDGLIVKVEEKVEEVEPEAKAEVEVEMEEVPVEAEVPVEVAEIAQPVVEAIVEAIIPVLEEVKSMTEEMKKMKEKMKQVENEFQAFKSEPATKKIANGKTEFSKNNNPLDAQIKAILELRKK